VIKRQKGKVEKESNERRKRKKGGKELNREKAGKKKILCSNFLPPMT
jgi:hypothetical protein